jgi:hypothetical protein
VVRRAFKQGFPESLSSRARALRQSGVHLLVISIYIISNVSFWFAQVLYVVYNNERSDVVLYIFVVHRAFRGPFNFAAWALSNPWSVRDMFRRVLRPCVKASRQQNEGTPLLGGNALLGRSTSVNDSVLPGQEDGDLEHPINRALRREIVLCTTWGIVDSYEQLDVSLERNVNVVRHSSRMVRRIHLPVSISHHPVDFVVYDDMHFKEVREYFGINDVVFLRSFSVSEEESTVALLERFTDGRSGSFFYFTRDAQYVVKTVAHREGKQLQQILPRSGGVVVSSFPFLFADLFLFSLFFGS